MNEQHRRPDGNAASRGLAQGIVLPGYALHGMGEGAGSLLIDQRHTIGKPEQLHPALLLQLSSVSETDLHQKGIAGVDRDRPDGGSNIVQSVLLLQPGLDQLFAYGREAVHGGRFHLYLLEGGVQLLGLLMVQAARGRLRVQARPTAQLLSGYSPYGGEGLL